MTFVFKTKGRGILFAKPASLDFHAIGDAALGGDPIKLRSVGASAAFACCGPLAWIVKLMADGCTSSMQAEYQNYLHIVTTLVYLVNCLREIGLPITRRIPLFTDAEAARAAALNPAHHQRTKHIMLKYHFIRQFTDDDEDNDKAFITMERLPAEFMILDVLTKITPRSVHEPAALQICGYGKLTSYETRALDPKRKGKHISVKHLYLRR
jgi:hypothetical protein